MTKETFTYDCGTCGGCGEADASGNPCTTCGGRGYFRTKPPKRDYEAAGRRAFERGQPLNKNPYHFGWPATGWARGWKDAAYDANKARTAQAQPA